MKLYLFILIFLLFSCNKREIIEKRIEIEELETQIETLETKINYYKSLDVETVNKGDNCLIENMIFNNDRKTYDKFISSGEFLHNQERYFFLILNMFLVYKERYYSYNVYRTISDINYYRLTNNLKNSKLYSFSLYFYALSVFEDSIQHDENILKSGLNPFNVKNPQHYLSKIYE